MLNSKYKVGLLICMLLLQVDVSLAQKLPFVLNNGAGTLRLGIVSGDKSFWLDEGKIKAKGNKYIIKNPDLKNSSLSITVLPLSDTDGIILKLERSSEEEMTLCYAYGGCNPNATAAKESNRINPDYCHDNVFSREGNAFKVYYGAVMKLKMIIGIAPIGARTLLADANQQTSPLSLIHSGKKTNATVLVGVYPWKHKESIYLCVYKQNAEADYNYYMLPALFEKELKK